MAANAITILEEILKAKRAELAPETSEPDFFEIFSAEQATKQHELSYEEIEDGIVDGEHDGGIDSLYTFVNGELVNEEIAFNVPKKSADVELIIVQSKSANGFSEAQLDRLIVAVPQLFDLAKDLDKLTQFNEMVRVKVDTFRQTYLKLTPKFPTLRVRFVLASKRADGDLHENLKKKAGLLVETVQGLFDDAEVEVNFWGARELVNLARSRPSQTFELKFDKILTGGNGYICLVKLPDFYSFLCCGGTTVRSDLFDSNVRDDQGGTEVNEDILKTLNGSKVDDFWWFNNGVTVLSSKAIQSGPAVTIENPQIVNGLQTSTQIATYFSAAPEEEPRAVMVKIVMSEDEEVRDRIIKATNNQNTVPPASLRATDKIQRDIEHYLKANGLYYDRRKNQYKNEGRPPSKIISINLLAQAAMSVFRAEPDNARARPSTIIKNDADYKSLFSDDVPLDAYLVVADTARRIELQLKTVAGLTARDRNNLRFYVLYWLIACECKRILPSKENVANRKGKVTDAMILEAITTVSECFTATGGTDQVAKGPNFKKILQEKLKEKFKQEFIKAVL